jgi:hypothetical protein
VMAHGDGFPSLPFPPLASLPSPSLLSFPIGSDYIAQAGLQLVILLPLPPECWDYRRVLPCPGMEQCLRLGDLSVLESVRSNGCTILCIY